MWHASIAVIGNKQKRPVPARLVQNKKLPYALGRQLLEGVGMEPTYEKQGEWAFHIRRSLTAEEIAGLDPAWLAIPAVDMAG